MSRTLAAVSLAAALLAAAPSWAQVDDERETDAGDTSQQVEESDEAFRRRMELEDARQRDPAYVDAQANYKRELEKIDGLPEASRDHIREQLIDVIMENGEWTPDDARRDYPYSPSPAARDDAALAQQEQEAWDEQIEKYHAREAAAFGAVRPAQGSGAEGAAGAGSAGSEGRSGGSGSGASADSSATYEPYEAARQADEERSSTAGVSQSALDFILGQGGPQRGPSPPAQGAESADAASTPASAPETAAAQTPAASTPETSQNETEAENAPRDLRGILAIEDLDKLGDAVRPPPPPEKEPETTPPDDG